MARYVRGEVGAPDCCTHQSRLLLQGRRNILSCNPDMEALLLAQTSCSVNGSELGEYLNQSCRSGWTYLSSNSAHRTNDHPSLPCDAVTHASLCKQRATLMLFCPKPLPAARRPQPEWNVYADVHLTMPLPSWHEGYLAGNPGRAAPAAEVAGARAHPAQAAAPPPQSFSQQVMAAAQPASPARPPPQRRPQQPPGGGSAAARQPQAFPELDALERAAASARLHSPCS